MMSKHSSLSNRYFFVVSLVCLLAPLLWAIHFGLVYTMSHFACSTESAEIPGIQISIAIVTLLAIALLSLSGKYRAKILNKLRPAEDQAETNRFLGGIMGLLTLLSLAAVSWTGSAVLFLPICS